MSDPPRVSKAPAADRERVPAEYADATVTPPTSWDATLHDPSLVFDPADDDVTPVPGMLRAWSVDDETLVIETAAPPLSQAHLQITSQFTPFAAGSASSAARKALRELAAQTTAEPTSHPAASVTDIWHLQGRDGVLTGQVFGDYEIGTILGEGGMGIIYRARERSLGRRVAVKTLSGSVAEDPNLRGRFEIEARAASLVRSPYVVQVFAAGSHNQIAYFVMEFVEGTNLGELIRSYTDRDQALPPERAAECTLHAARGLQAAAEHHIVHRDIKPSNLLMATDGTVKIADFGISRIQGESNLTRTGTAIGTPNYVSPEQGRGEVCDARSDIYSLGVVFYECLTGQKPFSGDTPGAVIYQHCYTEPTLPRDLNPQIPEHYQAIVLKCLQKDPANRYHTAAELVVDLERIRAGNLSITAVFNAKYGTGAEEAMRRYLDRSRRWVAPAIAGLLMVAIAGGGGLWWWQGRADERAEARRALERLRTDLRAALDAPQPPPPSAASDVDRLAMLAGPRDPDVARWRSKIAHVGELTQRLGRLDQATLADAELAGESRIDLDMLSVLVGETYPGMDRWRRRLLDTAAEVDRLRTTLAVLDRSGLVPLAEHEQLAPALARFTSLAGAQDADLRRWKAQLAAMDERLAALRATLAELDDAEHPASETRIAQLGSVLDEYLMLRGAGYVDEDASRWKALIDARRERLAALRSSLARLDEVEIVSAATIARLRKDLSDYVALVAVDDASLVRWQRRLADSDRAIAVLRQRCSVLDRSAGLSATELDAARINLERLRPLVDSDDEQVRRWSATLEVLDRRLAEDQAAVAVLDAGAPVSLIQLARAEQAIDALDARGLVREDQKQNWRKRIIAERDRVAALKQSLTVIDRPDVSVTAGLVDNVLLYGRLVGTDDPDYKRWYRHVIRAAQLRQTLAPLDRPEPVPDRARDLLAEYAGIVGEDEPQVRVWRSKLDRVQELRRMLSPLDVAAPIADDGLDRLDELMTLIGPFPGVDVWRAKLVRIRELVDTLSRELSPGAVRLASSAREHLTALGALVSMEEARMRVWSRRLAWLAGPGQPAWAARYSVDEVGPLATLALTGSPAVSVDFRYVPPGEFTMGSPPDEPGRDQDETQVRVTLSKGYWLAVHETRQDLWQAVTGVNPSVDPDPEHPVQRVSWNDVQGFLVALNARVPGLAPRLPTEAEWEHAARAGGQGPWHGPYGSVDEHQLQRLAWFAGGDEPADGVHAVGRRQPNQLGLHDVHGNVWEWCQDRYGYYSPVPVSDPLGFERDQRVMRGGSWGDEASRVRAANRLPLEPDFRSWYVGFRLAITADFPPEVRLEKGRSASGDAAEP